MKENTHECVHSKMSHTQLLCSFQKGKHLKMEIEMACNHCTKFVVWAHIWLVKYILIIKFGFFEFYNLFLYLSKIIGKKIKNSEFYNIYIIPMMIQNHVKSNNYSIYMNMKIFQTNLDKFWLFLCDLLRTSGWVTNV
jgi:hypothetical protein